MEMGCATDALQIDKAEPAFVALLFHSNAALPRRVISCRAIFHGIRTTNALSSTKRGYSDYVESSRFF